ncbi:PREDICTED: GDSL esterase/lipase At2g24560-like [Ipomoea nil]|uniref:GDSL esterase/lipase At2g24560-like n=1 Tax=Ipomoea nil TaxID=35883 RepID=UPI000901F53A|nr:PREDICTED: GDSL esterase/lipase At2g24560-like [Ipomoea nil]
MELTIRAFPFFFFILFQYAESQSSIPKFTAILVFGDSTVDTGNNNYIPTIFRANHPPYGLDYTNGIATGRFSDGQLVPDVLAQLLGLKQKGGVPPYLRPNISDAELRSGVSFASAGSGYDDLTATLSGAISMRKQMEYLKEYIGRVKKSVGEREGERIVKGGLVIVSGGSNDFVLNFYDVPTRRLEFSIGKYQDFLLEKLQSFVKELYDVGCRKIIVSGLPPIGCLPIQLTAKSPVLRKCVEKENSDAQSYNAKLQHMLAALQETLPGSKVLYADTYTPLLDLINNPQENGFVETKKGCCGSGLVEVGPLCNSNSHVCTNPSEYIYFDSIHLTESAYLQVAEYLIKDLLRKLSDDESR